MTTNKTTSVGPIAPMLARRAKASGIAANSPAPYRSCLVDPAEAETAGPTARDLYKKLASSRYGGIKTLRWAQLPANEQSYWEAVWQAASELLVPTGTNATEKENDSHPYS